MKYLRPAVALFLLIFCLSETNAQYGYFRPEFIGWPTDSTQWLSLKWSPDSLKTLWDNGEGSTATDSVFPLPPDTICVISMGDTICVHQDSITTSINGDTLCVIQGGDTTCVELGQASDTNLANTDLTQTMPRTYNLQSYYLRFQESGLNRFTLNPNASSPGELARLTESFTNANQGILALENNASSTHSDAMLRFQATGSSNRQYSLGVDRSESSFSFAEQGDLGADPYLRYYGGGDSLVVLKDIQIDAGLLDKDGDIGTSGQVLSSTASGVDWITAGGSIPINSLLAATGTNTINNGNHAQEWQWNTLAGLSGLKLSSTSTAAASNLQRLFEVSLSGANGTASQTTVAGYFSNTHTGTNHLNYGLYSTVTSSNALSSSVYANASAGIGVNAISTTGTAILATSTSNKALRAVSAAAAPTSTIEAEKNGSNSASPDPVISIISNVSSGGSGNGFGGTIDFYHETATDGTNQLANQIESEWTDATNATRTSRITFTGVSSGTESDLIYFEGDKRVLFQGRSEERQGTDVASVAGTITLSSNGNSFEITGTNAITTISNVGWQTGSIVTLLFASTASLVNDDLSASGTNISMKLAGGVNFNATADDVITLILSDIGGNLYWREVSRSIN